MDVSIINLAEILKNSSHINIIPIISNGNLQSTLININSAKEDELETLPGIGPISAKNMIGYRLENSPFRDIEEIQKVTGIGPRSFEKIKLLISIGE